MTIKRTEIVLRWETGDVVMMYSPKEKVCKSRIRKYMGGFFTSLGMAILFGNPGWKTYINRIEGENE